MPTRTVIRRKPESKPAATTDLVLGEAEIRSLSQELHEPAWMADRRLEAWHGYQSLPMPTVADEAWRRTDLRDLPIGRVRPGPAGAAVIPSDLLQPLVAETHGALLLLRPGHPAELVDGAAPKDQGVVFLDWAAAMRQHADLLRASLGTLVADGEGKFAALAAAAASDGVVVIVPPGVEVRTPLHSILWAPGTGNLFASRLLVVVGAGASVTYVHETASPTHLDGSTIHAGIVELAVDSGAHLRFVELQNWGKHVWNFTHEKARVGRDGNLEWIFGAVGSRLTKNFSQIDLVGEGAQGRLSGFYFADGLQHLDHDTRQNHLAPHTTSDLLYKGALLGQSRSVWRGMIYVAPGAQKADGYQANRNIVLSRQARADSIPGLEILADDVRCTHGATVGQLEEDPVFYLMSRGLPRHEAERLVVDGFFDPIMQRIPFEGVRDRFKSMISDKMG
jgi:Fe-S cluster assembly protein SufD